MIRRLAYSLLVAAAVLLVPSQAVAAEGDYSIDELSTELYVQDDASVHVIERQVLAFQGSNRGIVWYLHAPEAGESVRVAAVRVVPVDDGGTAVGDWTRLQLVDADPAKQGSGPGDTASYALRRWDTRPWYSYRVADGMMRAYFPAEDGQPYLLEVDYAVKNRVTVYRDVAELYWRYADSSLPATARDVTLQVALPVPEGEAAIADDNVLAWGHGPDSGSFTVGEDGAVVYHVDELVPGQYAEAHLVFPASWMTGASDTGSVSPVVPEQRKSAAVAEEAEWLDAGARGAQWDNKVRVLFCAIAVVVLVVAAVLILRFGRTPRSRRVLVRAACTLAVVAVGEQAFFREPLTTAILIGAALVVGIGALSLPRTDDEG